MKFARPFAAGLLALAPFALPAPLAAGPLSPNAGAFSGEGTLDDGDGNRGVWQASGTLADGEIAGTLSIDLAGKAMAVTMKPGPAYMENGRCILKGEEGRNRFELSGDCDSESFGPGRISGYFDGGPSVTGTFAGTLRWGPAAAAANRQASADAANGHASAAAVPADGVLPTAKLACGYRERIGGVVAGQLATYENRPSLMVFLRLGPDGTYRTNNSSGRFVREGDAIRLTSGAYAGALGRLRADSGGEPAVYFDLDENRRADGTPIVDAWNTFCVRQR